MRKQNKDICTHAKICICTSHIFLLRKFLRIYFSEMNGKKRGGGETWDTRKSKTDPEAYYQEGLFPSSFIFFFFLQDLRKTLRNFRKNRKLYKIVMVQTGSHLDGTCF